MLHSHLLPVVVLFIGCDADAISDDSGDEEAVVPFAVTSDAFAEGETIPTPHECGPPIANGPGDNVTPQLSWTAGPAETRSYAIVVRDVDARVGAFPDGIIHWTMYDIPVETREAPEGIEAQEAVGEIDGAQQAEIQNSGYFGYFGPCSPNTVNTYVYTVHAMGEETLPVEDDRSEINVAEYIESNALESVSLSGES